MRTAARWMGLLVIGAAVLVALGAIARPAALALAGLTDDFASTGAVGVATYLGVYALATWLMVPASWLQASAGLLFGPVIGFVVAWLGSTFSGAVSFAIGRSVLGRRLLARSSASGRFETLRQTVADGGIAAVVLIRIPPISPYNVVSYALGAIGVPLRAYLFGTLIGGVIPTVLYVALGSSASDLAAVISGEETGPGWVRWVGLAVSVTATLTASALAKRRLSTVSTVS